MKRMLLGLTLIFMLAASCSKTQTGPAIVAATGQLRDGGIPAADGVGFYIRLDSTGEDLSPENLPDAFKVPQIDEHVSFKFIDTGHRAAFGFLSPQGLRSVHLMSIARQ